MAYNFKGAAPTYQENLRDFTEKYTWALLSLFFGPWLLSIMFDFYEFIAESASEKGVMQKKDLIGLICALDEIVGLKIKRYGEKARECRSGHIPMQAVLADVTRPELQVKAIIAQMYALMRSVLDDPDLKVVLVRFKKPVKAEFYEWMPSDTRPSDDLLGDNLKKTFFYHISSNQQIGSIANISKNRINKTRIKWYSNNTDGTGSIIGFPIPCSHLNHIPFVLTLKSSVEGKFDANTKERTRKLIMPFLKRIELEYQMLWMREIGEPLNDKI